MLRTHPLYETSSDCVNIVRSGFLPVKISNFPPLDSSCHHPAMAPVYLLENNVRRVKPYYFEYKTPYKQRWHQRLLKDILTRELGQSPDVVEHGIDMGNIYVTSNNGKAGVPGILRFSDARQRLLEPHDIIYNLQHMHEPVVCHAPPILLQTEADGTSKFFCGGKLNGLTNAARIVQNCIVLFENTDFIVVNKPAGVPTHPSGIHRYNSVTEIVHHELGIPVWPCHRLDKGTLGVLVLAKTKEASKTFQMLIQTKKDSMEKWYIARVQGNFAQTSCTYTSPVFSINTAGSGYLNTNAEAVPAGCVTFFERLLYSKLHDESIVLCRPISGKMHQIRIHLRNMGFPITNDPLYNLANGPNAEKGKVEKVLYEAVLSRWTCFGINKTDPAPETVDVSPIVAGLRSRIDHLSTLRKKNDDTKIVSSCLECLRPIHQDNPDQGIYLHAWKISYSGDSSFCFQTVYPPWMFSDIDTK